jgi:hypothetical protein
MFLIESHSGPTRFRLISMAGESIEEAWKRNTIGKKHYNSRHDSAGALVHSFLLLRDGDCALRSLHNRLTYMSFKSFLSMLFNRHVVIHRAVSARVVAVLSITLSGNVFASSSGQAIEWGLIEQKCLKCHNSEDWAGGIAFDTLTAGDIAKDCEIWEKAVRKLRGRKMPPPGQPQPKKSEVDSLVAWLETRLDATPTTDPGRVGLHRLNRTEYAREIDRLLGLDVDVKLLLPNDVSSDGFDNVAAVLRVSPAFIDQYISAARNISRQAIGRVDAKPDTYQFRAKSDIDQSRHVDGLPLGTRGGMLIEHYFPVDGEYDFSIREFFFTGAGYVTKIDSPHKVILTIDDVRVFEHVIGGTEDQKAVDVNQAIAADELQKQFDHIRTSVKAGMRRIGVTFVQRSFAQSDSPLQPIAELPEMERFPTIPGLDLSGPFSVTGVGDTESRRRVFVCRPTSASDELPCAKQILSRLASQAFRRPATNTEVQTVLNFYSNGRELGNFDAGIESGLTAILSSTKFLYRAEQTPANVSAGDIVPLTDFELASRLAFFLWSQGPDDQLMGIAANGTLRKPEVLSAQIKRMLADPRSQSLVTNFAFQWLNVNKIETLQPDPVLYPDFDRNLRDSFKEEMRLFLDSILRSDRSVLELLSSNQTFLNERLASHYGVPNVLGDQFRPVTLENSNRSGLLGKGALLMGTAYGNRTSPVLRGNWLLENIMGTPPTAPPPGVETLKDIDPGKQALTMRERLAHHRTASSCNSCHGVIDPLGFAMENFDVVGAWRDKDRDAGSMIDASGTLASGEFVKGPIDLRNALLAKPDQFVQTLTEKLMTFALGRALRAQDMPTVRHIVRQAAADQYRFESIVAGIVNSAMFQTQSVPMNHKSVQAMLEPASSKRL